MTTLRAMLGEGSFEKDGKLIKYPIKKLLITNALREQVELKIDKTSWRILGFMYDFKDEGIIEDENGVQCSLFLLKEKNEVEVK